MKKSAFLILLFVFSFVFGELSAASYEFKIIGMKGDVKVKTAKKNKWIKAKTAGKLGKKDRIKLGKNSYVGLVHKNGKTIELKKRGEYKISSLMKKVKKKGSDVSSKFADYVSEEISETDDLFASGDYQENMGTTGAVERATDNDRNSEGKISSMTGLDENEFSGLNETMSFLNSFESDKLEVRIPKVSYVIDEVVLFSWYAKDGVSKYKFELYDAKNKMIYTEETDQIALVLNLREKGIKEGKCYYWHIKAGEEVSDESCIFLVGKQRSDEIKEMVNSIESTYDEDSATRYLVLAQLYDDENLQNRADIAYQKALELSPDTEGYKRLYAKYLLKLGLKDEAMEIAGEKK